MKFARLLVVALAASITASSFSQHIQLNFASFDPLISTPQIPSELQSRTISDGITPMLIQFQHTLSAQEYADLANHCQTIVGYIPNLAYLVMIDSHNLGDLKSNSNFRWSGPYQPAYKLSSNLSNASNAPILATISLFPNSSLTFESITAQTLGLEVRATEQVSQTPMMQVYGSYQALVELAKQSAIQFIEPSSRVQLRNNTVRWIDQTNISNSTPLYSLGVHGEGQIISVVDDPVRSTHVSFADSVPIGPAHRKLVYYGGALSTSTHGTHVAGTAAGDPGIFDDRRGVAYLAKLAYSPVPAFTEGASYAAWQTHYNVGARLFTNSWGDDATINYNALCRGVDSFSYDFEDALVCFAATNTSFLKNPENAKNLLAVGNCGDTPNQETITTGGAGPTADGRRKPEIFAPGTGIVSASGSSDTGTSTLTGTSMASPSIAASGALVRQYLMEGRLETGNANPARAITPSGALIKAILLNSTADMTGVAGYPNDQEGWGRILLDNALTMPGDTRKALLQDLRRASGLSTGGENGILAEVTANTTNLKVTMVFTDAPASASTNTANAVVNNLNLIAVAPSGTVYLGNVFASGQSTTGGSADAKNNVEMVLRTSPEVGIWRLRVQAPAINFGGTQGYGLFVSGAIQTPSVSGVVNFGQLSSEFFGPLSRSVTLEFLNSSNIVQASVNPVLNGDGTFSVPIPYTVTGSYKVRIKGIHWLAKATALQSYASHTLATITLTNGDCDNDNEIGPGDFGQISTGYGKVLGDVGYSIAIDLDEDGEIGPSDFGILSSGYGQIGD